LKAEVPLLCLVFPAADHVVAESVHSCPTKGMLPLLRELVRGGCRDASGAKLGRVKSEAKRR
jgi:hypothetical protein